jgi:hypothetical protein
MRYARSPVVSGFTSKRRTQMRAEGAGRGWGGVVDLAGALPCRHDDLMTQPGVPVQILHHAAALPIYLLFSSKFVKIGTHL